MKRYILVALFVVAAFLRLYQLWNVPPSPSLDEVSIGYNAYSIMMTGKDEYGSPFPLLLRAYDDFRPALYVYLTIPFIYLFGLTAFAVRLPAFFLSLITLWATYRIGVLLGKKYLGSDGIGGIAAGILALSPWHIYLSRLGHEANLGLTLTVLGLYFLLRAVIAKRGRDWIYTAVFFALSLHGYQSQKLIVPCIAVVTLLLFWKELLREKKQVMIAVVAGSIIAIPAMIVSLSPEGMSRFKGTSAFAPDSPVMTEATSRYADAIRRNDLMGRVIHSKYTTGLMIFAGNYGAHFSPGWLFTGGDREAHKVPGMGLLYLWEAPMLIAGLLFLTKRKIPQKIRILLFAYLLASPIPASITTGAPHAMRFYTAIPLLQIMEALGCWYVASIVGITAKRSTAVVVAVAVAYGMTMFWNGYFVRFPREQSDSFQYAVADAVSYIRAQSETYPRTEISNQGSLYQSYMFFLFYTKYDPQKYLEQGGTKSGGFEASHTVDSYAFGFLPKSANALQQDTLYLYDSTEVPDGARVLSRFAHKNGRTAIVAVTK